MNRRIVINKMIKVKFFREFHLNIMEKKLKKRTVRVNISQLPYRPLTIDL
jgi:hypothetical protein